MKSRILGPVLLAALVALQTQAGFRYTVKNTDEGGARGGNANSTMQMTTDGDKARTDFVEGGPMRGHDGYILTQDGGKTMTMVSPKDKTYMKWDMEAMMGMANSMSAMMKMEVTDLKSDKLLDEAGETILGYPTRHYKFHTTYGMSMTVMGFQTASTVAKDEEFWTTTKIDVPALGNWFKKAPKMSNEALDKLMREQMNRLQGMPLKMISVQTTTDKSGKSQTFKHTMEVTEAHEFKPAASLFEIPAGYTETSMGGNQEQGGAADKGKGGPDLAPFMKMFNK